MKALLVLAALGVGVGTNVWIASAGNNGNGNNGNGNGNGHVKHVKAPEIDGTSGGAALALLAGCLLLAGEKLRRRP